MFVLDRVMERRDAIYEIARRHNVQKLWVFGSVARKEERPESDVDFLAELPEGFSYFRLCDLMEELRVLLGVKVDVISHKALSNSPCFAYNVRKDMLPV